MPSRPFESWVRPIPPSIRAAEPKVSVEIITFNQAPFIARAIESVLMQQVSFPYEIVIADDCSTDGTTAIIQSYARRYPHIFRILLNGTNLGAARNFRMVLQHLTGQYVACLEGDDYWTDVNKLQMQVDYLDTNPDCAIVHHRVAYIQWPEEVVVGEWPALRYRVERQDTDDLVLANFIQTCSIVFRRACMPILDERFDALKLGDWPLCVLLSQRGRIGYIDRLMAHYRVHPTNTWNNRSLEFRLQALEQMARYLVESVEEKNRDSWRDVLIALSLANMLLAVRTFTFKRLFGTTISFALRAAEFRKPLWLVNRAWRFRSVIALGLGTNPSIAID